MKIDTYIISEKIVFSQFFDLTNVGYWFEISTGWRYTKFSTSDTISIPSYFMRNLYGINVSILHIDPLHWEILPIGKDRHFSVTLSL